MAPPPRWQALGLMVTRHVHRGHVTTYGDLSEAFHGHTRASRSIGTMIKAWAAQDPRNCSHRVVNDDGTLPEADLHHERLEKEGVTFDDEGKVLLAKHKVTLPPHTKKE